MKKRLGRPPLKKGQGRSSLVTIRLKPTEAEKLRDVAKAEDQSISDWLRSNVLKLLDERIQKR